MKNELHPAVVAREFNNLTKLLELWSEETFADDDGSDLEITELKARIDRFAEWAQQALPKIEWLLLNGGKCLSPEQRYQVARIRGELLIIFNWQEAL
jgi:hypothetical protein